MTSLVLGADWCPGCRVMKTRVIPQLAKAWTPAGPARRDGQLAGGE